MTQSKMVIKAEELQNEVKKISSIQLALYEAIFNGDNEIKAYEWAFCALMELTIRAREEIETLVNSAFEELKKERQQTC